MPLISNFLSHHIEMQVEKHDYLWERLDYVKM